MPGHQGAHHLSLCQHLLKAEAGPRPKDLARWWAGTLGCWHGPTASCARQAAQPPQTVKTRIKWGQGAGRGDQRQLFNSGFGFYIFTSSFGIGRDAP